MKNWKQQLENETGFNLHSYLLFIPVLKWERNAFVLFSITIECRENANMTSAIMLSELADNTLKFTERTNNSRFPAMRFKSIKALWLTKKNQHKKPRTHLSEKQVQQRCQWRDCSIKVHPGYKSLRRSHRLGADGLHQFVGAQQRPEG